MSAILKARMARLVRRRRKNGTDLEIDAQISSLRRKLRPPAKRRPNPKKKASSARAKAPPPRILPAACRDCGAPACAWKPGDVPYCARCLMRGAIR